MTRNSDQFAVPTIGEDGRFSLNGVEYVIIRSEVFDNVKELLQTDHAELRRRLAHSSEANGWDEPGMEAYDSYPANPIT